METLSLLSGPFVFLDWALPFIVFLLAALILTGNFAVKSFFDRCGIGLYGRTLCGGLVAILGLALITGFEAIATEVLIAMLVILAAMAMRRGGSREIAAANLVLAAILIPVAIIP
ncbi:hypothetical protein [Pseudorhodoplanes sinuspersici]|uniref:Uncharacterized protein n=1 Tax=Pseudorhodoplanes sinuspersici TaxID=1235591 RepID=A0A1W6ZMA7_9HYPH|nr:hypothetical protein [Pseudorhodoplanes sinuspersici]ARP98452.1 hypothetical protein CAK95_04610 [Pseudorhodoplanes sinuspersici]RKE66122.1 hypothetical protein DFP91_5700 [Pseudorhodoplanes sinuspersici]